MSAGFGAPGLFLSASYSFLSGFFPRLLSDNRSCSLSAEDV